MRKIILALLMLFISYTCAGTEAASSIYNSNFIDEPVTSTELNNFLSSYWKNRDVKEREWGYLEYALEYNNLKMVFYLLSQGVEFNKVQLQSDEDYWYRSLLSQNSRKEYTTPYHTAIRKQNPELFFALLDIRDNEKSIFEKGFYEWKKTTTGGYLGRSDVNELWFFVVDHFDFDFIMLILQNEKYAKNLNGYQVIEGAFRHRHLDWVSRFVEMGCVLSTDHYGCCIGFKYIEGIQFLISNGVEVTWEVVDKAASSGNHEILDLVLSAY